MATEVRAAYFRAVGASQIEQMRRHIAEAAAASYEMAHRMHTAGNTSAPNSAGERGHYEQARMDHARRNLCL